MKTYEQQMLDKQQTPYPNPGIDQDADKLANFIWREGSRIAKEADETIKEMEEMALSAQSAVALCDALEIDSYTFDQDSEEYILLKENNPALLEAFEIIYTLASYAEQTGG